eukprot:g26685.t1
MASVHLGQAFCGQQFVQVSPAHSWKELEVKKLRVVVTFMTTGNGCPVVLLRRKSCSRRLRVPLFLIRGLKRGDGNCLCDPLKADSRNVQIKA